MKVAAFRRHYKKAFDYPYRSQPPGQALVTILKGMDIPVASISRVTQMTEPLACMRIVQTRKGVMREVVVNRDHEILKDSSLNIASGNKRLSGRNPLSDVRAIDEY